MDVRRLDLALGEAERSQQVEIRRGEGLSADAELIADELLAKGPLVEGELDVEGGRQRLLDLGDRFIRETLGLQRGDVDAGGIGERAVADCIGLDLRDLAFAIAKRAQRLGYGAVD